MLLKIINQDCKETILLNKFSPKFLASVTCLHEAQIALDADVDIIDLKNPQEGSLGALSLKVIQEIVALIDNRKIVSTTIGDLVMDPYLIETAVQKMSTTGVDIIKIGFFGTKNHLECIEALKNSSNTGFKLVAVLFADQSIDLKILDVLEKAGFYGVMLDTSNKNSGNLLAHQSLEKLAEFTMRARTRNLFSGLAGSLSLENIQLLSKTKSDYLGFRGGICHKGDRKLSICPNQIKEVKKMMHSFLI